MSNLVFRLELRRSRTLLIALVVTTVLYAGFIAGYYPTLVADTALIDQMLKSFPSAMKAAFGMEGNLGDQGTYLNVYLLSMLWPMVAAIAAIVIPTRTIAADLDRGFLELSLATPVGRRRYLGTAIVTQGVALAVLVAAMVLTILLVFSLVGVGFDPGRYALVALLSFVFGCAIAAVTTFLSVLTLRRGVAAGAVAGILALDVSRPDGRQAQSRDRGGRLHECVPVPRAGGPDQSRSGPLGRLGLVRPGRHRRLGSVDLVGWKA